MNYILLFLNLERIYKHRERNFKMAKNNKENLKNASKVAKKVMPSKSTRKKIYKKSGIAKAMPYISIFFAIILTVFLIVGENGTWAVEGVCKILTGLLGGAAYLLPLYLGFLGVIWCIFDLKWNTKKYSEDEISAAHKRAVAKTTEITLILFFFSVFMGVLSDVTDVDIEALWSEGYESFVQGGVIGGAIGWLFNIVFGVAISSIIIVLILLVCLCFAIGLTPSYIVARVRSSREAKEANIEIDEKRAEEKYDKLREKEIARLKKKKEKELEERKKQELQSFVREQKEQDEPMNAEVRNKNAEAYESKAPDFSDDDIDAMFDEDTPQDPEPTPLELEEDNNIKDYGGDPVIDGNTENVEDLLRASQKNAGQPSKKEVTDEEIALGKLSNEEISEDLANVLPDDEGSEDNETETMYVFPPVDFLSPNQNPIDSDCKAELQENARILRETLKSFKVDIRDISYSRGPTITRYELRPEVGTRVRSIANLVDDIALNLATSGVRIEAPIPNKPAVGIEVPNKVRATVYLRDLIENAKFGDSKSKLTSCLGMDVGGNPVYFDIGKMPHLLIAGTTGSGKSVCINTIILSILYKARPSEVKLILVDPKQVEFTVYENIPHLYCPIVSEPKKAAGALASAVSEMERRFELIKSVGVRNIDAYNELAATDAELEYLPKMVIIIDELADLMMTARDEVETSICRLAQKARAAGIHVILGTQRPSVDVITGLIKANVPSRIACTVTSQVDSRTIIDVSGAENLIGYGDMLFSPIGSLKPMRVQGAFVSDSEVEKIIGYIRENNGTARYNQEFIKSMEENAKACGNSKKGGGDYTESESFGEGGDSKFHDAVKLAIEQGKISTSLMQRRLGVGYGRAAKMIDTMEELGYVSAPEGNKPRRVLITMEEYLRRVSEGSLGEEEE